MKPLTFKTKGEKNSNIYLVQILWKFVEPIFVVIFIRVAASFARALFRVVLITVTLTCVSLASATIVFTRLVWVLAFRIDNMFSFRRHFAYIPFFYILDEKVRKIKSTLERTRKKNVRTKVEHFNILIDH